MMVNSSCGGRRQKKVVLMKIHCPSIIGILLLILLQVLWNSVIVEALASSSSSGSPSSPTPTTTTNNNIINNNHNNNNKHAIIVGGGPIGLATALTLSNIPHCYDVTILEQSVDDNHYDPTKAYLYNVNKRGQEWMMNNIECNNNNGDDGSDGGNEFSSSQSVLSKLQERGSKSDWARFTLIPGNPDQLIPQPKATIYHSETNTKTSTSSSSSTASTTTTTTTTVEDKKNDDNPSDKNSRQDDSYWIPRHSMIELLEETIREQEEQVRQEEQHEQKSVSSSSSSSLNSMKKMGSITLLKGKKFTALEQVVVKKEATGKQEEDGQQQQQLMVSVQDISTGNMENYCGNLIGSLQVRSCLAKEGEYGSTSTTTTSPTTSWLHGKASQFKIKQWKSPATGLRMKVLQLPPSGFIIPNAKEESPVQTQTEWIYAIRGVNTGPKNFLSLGILPVKDPSMIFAANAITRPCHEIWKLTNGPSIKSWFSQNFPRLPWDQLVSDEEWERFSQAKGTSFPHCQLSPALQVTSPDQTAGVVLVGDSAHAFPPDIGQGINSGLCDVVALDRALKQQQQQDQEEEQPSNLGKALEEYERVQVPQHKALIRIARFGAPYQYRQPLRKDRIGRMLNMCNLAIRLLLSKLTFGVIQPSCAILLQNPKLSYRQVMLRADLTTGLLYSVLFFTFWKFWGGACLTRLVSLF